jgi:hypothetical protein
VRPRREPAEPGSVYWMEASKRRQALQWLERGDLTHEERGFLETFVERYRTAPGLSPHERRSLMRQYFSLARRLASASRGTGSAAGAGGSSAT